MLAGARTLQVGDDIVVKGFPRCISCIRGILTLYQGRPGVFYKIVRWDRGLKCMVPVVVPWLEVVYFRHDPSITAGQRAKILAEATRREQAFVGKRRRRRDVTAEMESLFGEDG
jgi:hypothetical protein